jgi:hypothetical protein
MSRHANIATVVFWMRLGSTDSRTWRSGRPDARPYRRVLGPQVCCRARRHLPAGSRKPFHVTAELRPVAWSISQGSWRRARFGYRAFGPNTVERSSS